MPHYTEVFANRAEASVRDLAASRRKHRFNAISGADQYSGGRPASAIFRYILKVERIQASMRRTVTTEEVRQALYLLVGHICAAVPASAQVDSGYHVVGMKPPDAPISLGQFVSKEIARLDLHLLSTTSSPGRNAWKRRTFQGARDMPLKRVVGRTQAVPQRYSRTAARDVQEFVVFGFPSQARLGRARLTMELMRALKICRRTIVQLMTAARDRPTSSWKV